MIPQAAIDAFLKEPREDHRWLKQLTHKQVDAAIAALRPAPNLNPGFRAHQKVGFLLGVAYPRFAYWYDMGVGKTMLALELLRYWWECGLMRRTIILVTSEKAFPTWEKQIQRWKIDIPYITLGNSPSRQKWAQFEQFDKGLIILTYPGMVRMLSKQVKVKGKAKTRLKIDETLLDKFIAGAQALILDESTRAGHHESLISQGCSRIGERMDFCYALAGRPFGRDPLLLWAQYNILDGGDTFGETLGLFRAAFYTAEQNPHARGKRAKYAKDYTFQKRRMPRLMDMAQHRSLAYAAEECIDVPKFVPLIEEVSLPEEAEAYYKKVVEQVIASKGNLQEMKNAFIRMRQLSSGFLGFRNDESGKRVEVAFDENPKLDRLLELLEGLSDDRKAVVFYDFTYSGRKIMESLKEIGRHGIWLWSGTKDSTASLQRFQDRPDCTVAIINNRVGAYSLDGLQEVANYTMFYESPVSVIDREQAERRLRRDGQLRKVFQYDLVTKGTLDRRILQFHREGDDLLKALRINPQLLLKD